MGSLSQLWLVGGGTKEEGSNRCKVAGFEDGGRGPDPRNMGSLWKLEKVDADSPLEPPEENESLPAS